MTVSFRNDCAGRGVAVLPTKWKAWGVAAALMFGVTATAPAAEPSISVLESNASVKVDGYISRLSAQILSQAGAASGADSGLSLGIDFNLAPESTAGFASMSAADQSFIRAAKGTYDLFLSFGGNASDRLSLLQRQDNRYYVGLDGEGGRWLSSPEEALSFLLQQLIQAEFQLPGKNGAAACPLNFYCILLALYDGQAEIVAHASRDSTITVELKGEGFSNLPGVPVLLAPDGVIVHSVTFVDAETIQARLSILPTASLGVNVLRVFNEGSNFRSLADYGLNILIDFEALNAVITGTETVQTATATGGATTLSDDHADNTAEATEFTNAIEGRLEVTADSDLFRLTVTVPGTLRITSSGPTDVFGALETADGTVVKTDDDSGVRYNFDLQTAVSPGVYFVRVTHCCTGTGAYRLSASFVGG